MMTVVAGMRRLQGWALCSGRALTSFRGTIHGHRWVVVVGSMAEIVVLAILARSEFAFDRSTSASTRTITSIVPIDIRVSQTVVFNVKNSTTHDKGKWPILLAISPIRYGLVHPNP